MLGAFGIAAGIVALAAAQPAWLSNAWHDQAVLAALAGNPFLLVIATSLSITPAFPSLRRPGRVRLTLALTFAQLIALAALARVPFRAHDRSRLAPVSLELTELVLQIDGARDGPAPNDA